MRRIALLAAACGCAMLPALAQTPSALDLFTRADKGYCIACHQLPEGVGPATRSNLGPKLDGTRMRMLGREALRARLNDPMAANPDTPMPPYGRHKILDAGEIDRLVEFLHALP